jgi:hypothetical protein
MTSNSEQCCELLNTIRKVGCVCVCVWVFFFFPPCLAFEDYADIRVSLPVCKTELYLLDPWKLFSKNVIVKYVKNLFPNNRGCGGWGVVEEAYVEQQQVLNCTVNGMIAGSLIRMAAWTKV